MLNEVYENAQVGKSSRWNAPAGVAVGLLLAVMAAGAGLYALWQRMQTRSEPAVTAVATQAPATEIAQPPPPAASAQPAAPAADLTPAGPAARPPDTPAAGSTPADTGIPAAGAASTSVPAALDPGKISVDLAATEPTWVSLSSDGKTVFTGILNPNQTRQFTVSLNAKLTTGNAAGLDVKLNGKPVGPIGPRGQVRTVVFTADNVQILPPRPKTASEAPPDL